MGLQFVRTTLESTFNTFPGTPPGGSQIDLFMTSDNDMTVRAQPMFSPIRDAGTGSRLVRMIPGRTKVGGGFSSFLFPSQTSYLLGLATGTATSGTGGVLIGAAPCLDLPSFTIDHLIDRDFDCGKEYARYTGNKISRFNLKSDMSEGGWLWSFDAEVIGSTKRTITGSDFATPALSAYPTDDPYQYFHTAGNVSINGGVRTNYQSLSLDIQNTIEAFADENIYASDVKWLSRTITFTIKSRYKSPADRLLYEAGTKVPASIEINNGTHTITFNFGNQCIITSVTDGLPMGGIFTQTLTFTPMMDSTLSPPTDFSFTVT